MSPEDVIKKVAGKLFSVLFALFLLWLVVDLGISGYRSVHRQFSGVKDQETSMNGFLNTVDTAVNSRTLTRDDFIRLFEHAEANSEGYFTELGLIGAYNEYLLHKYYAVPLRPSGGGAASIPLGPVLDGIAARQQDDQLQVNSAYESNIELLKLMVAEAQHGGFVMRLPLQERAALSALESQLERVSDPGATASLKALRQVMEQRYGEYQALDRENERNQVYGILGLAFGVVGLVLYFFPPTNLLAAIQRFISDFARLEVRPIYNSRVVLGEEFLVCFEVVNPHSFSMQLSRMMLDKMVAEALHAISVEPSHFTTTNETHKSWVFNCNIAPKAVKLVSCRFQLDTAGPSFVTAPFHFYDSGGSRATATVHIRNVTPKEGEFSAANEAHKK